MKKTLLVLTCLVMAIFLLPGGAAWDVDLNIDGSISTGDWSNEEGQDNGDEGNMATATFSAPSTSGSDQTKSGDEDDDQAADKKPDHQYIVEINVQGKGNTSPSGNVDMKSGSTLDISAVPEQGWQLSHWDSGGNKISMPVVVTEHMKITAVFKEKPASDDSNGSDEGNDEDKQDEEEKDSRDKKAADTDEKKAKEDKESGSSSDDSANDE